MFHHQSKASAQSQSDADENANYITSRLLYIYTWRCKWIRCCILDDLCCEYINGEYQSLYSRKKKVLLRNWIEEKKKKRRGYLLFTNSRVRGRWCLPHRDDGNVCRCLTYPQERAKERMMLGLCGIYTSHIVSYMLHQIADQRPCHTRYT